MTRPIRVLHLEDNLLDAELVEHRLDVDGLTCDIAKAQSRDGFEAALAREAFDLIISDYSLPGYDGIAALKWAPETQPDTPVIIISGTLGEEEAVKCLKIGATDYLLKDHLDRLVPAVHRALQEADARRTRRQTEQALLQREQALRENGERTDFALAAAGMGVWEVEFATNRMVVTAASLTRSCRRSFTPVTGSPRLLKKLRSPSRIRCDRPFSYRLVTGWTRRLSRSSLNL